MSAVNSHAPLGLEKRSSCVNAAIYTD